MKKTLGSSGLKISEIGYGAMGLTEMYGQPNPKGDAIAIIRHRRSASKLCNSQERYTLQIALA